MGKQPALKIFKKNVRVNNLTYMREKKNKEEKGKKILTTELEEDKKKKKKLECRMRITSGALSSTPGM